MARKLAVIGAGLMGSGIAQVSAQSGYDVVVREVDQGALDKGIAKIEKQLGRAVEKGKLEQSAADEILGRITTTLEALSTYGSAPGAPTPGRRRSPRPQPATPGHAASPSLHSYYRRTCGTPLHPALRARCMALMYTMPSRAAPICWSSLVAICMPPGDTQLLA